MPQCKSNDTVVKSFPQWSRYKGCTVGASHSTSLSLLVLGNQQSCLELTVTCAKSGMTSYPLVLPIPQLDFRSRCPQVMGFNDLLLTFSSSKSNQSTVPHSLHNSRFTSLAVIRCRPTCQYPSIMAAGTDANSSLSSLNVCCEFTRANVARA